ncbi:MAG: hypothetical protein ACTSU5_12060 [Promethearchaeota archaeon]
MVEYFNEQPGVVAYEYLSLCTDAGAEFIKDAIRRDRLDRIIIAA